MVWAEYVSVPSTPTKATWVFVKWQCLSCPTLRRLHNFINAVKNTLFQFVLSQHPVRGLFLVLGSSVYGGCGVEEEVNGGNTMEESAQVLSGVAVPPPREGATPERAATLTDGGTIGVGTVEEREPSGVSVSEPVAAAPCVTLNDCAADEVCTAQTDPPTCVAGVAQARGPLGQAPPPVGLFELDPSSTGGE